MDHAWCNPEARILLGKLYAKIYTKTDILLKLWIMKNFLSIYPTLFLFWWRFWSIFPSRFLTLEKHQTLSHWRSLTIWSPYLLWIATVTHKTYEKNIENLLKYWENSIKWILHTNSFLLSISASGCMNFSKHCIAFFAGGLSSHKCLPIS